MIFFLTPIPYWNGEAAGYMTFDLSPSPSQTMLVNLDLPREEKTVLRVSPSLTLAQLLLHVCERRNLDPRRHWFDLPATPESLADKTLQQLKLNTLRVVETGVCVCLCGTGVCVCA